MDESPRQLDVIYLDDHCVAINKPAGLLVHRTAIASRATEFALQLLRDQLGKKVYPVHRLDRATSGVLIFGLSGLTAKALTKQLEDRVAVKTYTAFVRGFCDGYGVMDRPLRDMGDARSYARSQPERDAVTEFRLLQKFELPFSDGKHETSRYSLIELRPHTGRRHQIRRHLKHASHPIVGDTTHGDHRHNQRFLELYGLDRMLLASTRLQIGHPVEGQLLDLTAPLGTQFDGLLDAIEPFAIGA